MAAEILKNSDSSGSPAESITSFLAETKNFLLFLTNSTPTAVFVRESMTIFVTLENFDR